MRFLNPLLIPLLSVFLVALNAHGQDKAACCTADNSTESICCHGHDLKYCCTVKNVFQAPIGVMGDHNHHAGGWMFSYRYMHMNMEGNKMGTNEIENTEVFENYMVAPHQMNMHMHMLGTMYSPTDRLTFMAMLPYQSKSMNLQMMMGMMGPDSEPNVMSFNTISSGVGDISITALYTLLVHGEHDNHLLLGAGLSIPTGSILQKDNTPMVHNMQLPYPMQLGSGTFDLLPALTYTITKGNTYWGVQAKSKIRIGENEREYSFGNSLEYSTWYSHQFKNWISASMRIKGITQGTISGADPMLNAMMVPTANTQAQGGNRIDALVGFNFYVQRKSHQGHKLGIEGGIPLHEDLNGPQLSVPYQLHLGWQYAF